MSAGLDDTLASTWFERAGVEWFKYADSDSGWALVPPREILLLAILKELEALRKDLNDRATRRIVR